MLPGPGSSDELPPPVGLGPERERTAHLRAERTVAFKRLVFSDRWAQSLSGPSPACRSPVRLAARRPLACSPSPPRFPAPPRFAAPDRARAVRRDGRRHARADRAAAAQAVAAPPRPNSSARACRCRRRRRSTRCPCVVRGMLCVWQMASEIGDGTRVACMCVDLSLEPL